jgi:hypothetical protein
MIANQAGNLLTSRQITSQITKDCSGYMFPLHGMFRRRDPTGFSVGLGGNGLGGVVEERREDQHNTLVVGQRRPFLKLGKLLANHLGVGPDISLGMPLGILIAVRHRLTPWLSFGPRHDIVEGCLFEFLPVHDQISTPSASWFGTIA